MRDGAARLHARYEPRPGLRLGLACSAAVWASGCGDHEPRGNSATDPTVGLDTLSATDGDDDGSVDESSDKLDVASHDVPPSDTDGCESIEEMATLEKKPVDIVLVVDTSGSMEDIVAGIESGINGLLTDIVSNADIDVRVIVASAYGSGVAICFTMPLGPDDCMPPGPNPPAGPQLFHYDRGFGSGGMLTGILNTYSGQTSVANPALYAMAPNGWQAWVRPEARKQILVATDANSLEGGASVGTQFDTDLLALAPEQFGTADARNYVFHTIAGFDPQDGVGTPWPPEAGIVDGTCDGNSAGKPLQQVSILTGGLRFSICQPQFIGNLFTTLATTVVESSPVSCDFPIPTPQDGSIVDPDTLEMDYSPGGGAPEIFHQVPSLDMCEPAAFWVDAMQIHLCPEACTVVQADDAATVRIRYGCDVGYDPG
jgi:hypothetical protein